MYIFLIVLLSINLIFSLDYSLQDFNNTSPTYGEVIGPSYLLESNKLTITYFGWEA